MYQQPDTFAHYLTSQALHRMQKAVRKFPQPNYVTAKVAEETGELIKEAVHLAENRGSRERLEDEAIDALAMIFRLVMEGDQTIGLGPKEPSTDTSNPQKEQDR